MSDETTPEVDNEVTTPEAIEEKFDVTDTVHVMTMHKKNLM